MGKKVEEHVAVGTREKRAKTEVGDEAGNDSNGGEFGCVMSRLFEFEESERFRIVVSFL